MDNPAARLVAILEPVAGYPKASSAATAWRRALGLEADNELFRSLAGVIHLADAVLTRVDELPEEEERDFLAAALAPLSELPRLFENTTLAKARWGEFDAITGPVVIKALHACSRAFRRAGLTEARLSDGAISRLLGDVKDWVNEVASDDSLDRNYKLFIVGRLRDVEAALIGYRIGGFDQVQAAVSALVGTALLVEPAQSPSFITRVGNLWRALLGAAQGAQAIAGAAEKGAAAIDAIHKLTN